MSSFLTLLPLEFLRHEPEQIVSFITSIRPLFNCSIIPYLLSDEELWRRFSFRDRELKWYLLFALSDTLQFASRMCVPLQSDSIVFAEKILKPLINDHPYFTRTLKHFSVASKNCEETLVKKGEIEISRF